MIGTQLDDRDKDEKAATVVLEIKWSKIFNLKRCHLSCVLTDEGQPVIKKGKRKSIPAKM